ncbi:MAG: response regulator transcription factor [Muribaculum sp.]|nr:response regulator transcription factor [Muribaculum sp.]
MKKILIVDDHPVVLEGLAHVFSEAGYNVVKASTANDAMKLAEKNKHRIQTLVIDLTLNADADGLLLIRKLRKAHVKAPVVVYTMHEELWNISLLLESDVEGIVLKGERIEELLEAVAAVNNGGRFISPVFKERMEVLNDASGKLTAKEINIINLISNGESSADISCKMCISTKTVEYHRSNIMKKLDAKNMTQAIRNAVKLGIISSIIAGTPLSMDARDNTVLNPVDLGLSVKWADRNLDAESELDSGGFYSFGETQTKEYYDWSTYQHCDDGDIILQHYLGENISGTEYDAAYMLLGEGWRMPTLEEVEELLEHCMVTNFPSENGNHAYTRIAASNGNFIDIPICGYMNKDKLLYSGKEAEILTGSMDTDEEEEDGIIYRINAPYVMACTNTTEPLVIMASSHLGFNIRPVNDGMTGVEIVTWECMPETIYSLDGRMMGSDTSSLPSGIYVKVRGGKAEKVLK